VPLVAMVSYTIVHHRGPERFVKDALEAGFSGAIVPDLPVEEADELAKLAAKHDFKLILLVTPTTPKERATKIAQLSTGFLYCVSVVGITGERSQLSPDLLEQLRWLRTQTMLPMCVGFGISTPDHVKMLRDTADGVIVGSAIVRKLGTGKPVDELLKDVGDLVQQLADAATN
jgi:tryptophan synthase alpha chain